jgi:hypothetical protein
MIMLTPPGGEPFEVARVRNVPISIGQSWPYLLIGLLVVLLAGGAELVGEVVQYGKTYRLAYIRGPEGIIVGLAERIHQATPQA